MKLCPCGSGIPDLECCHIFISGEKTAPTAEALMRSRYTAYTHAELGYIERTMKGPALLRFNKQKSEERARYIKWHKLDIIKTFQKDKRHFVEFIASLSINNKYDTLHERSEFLFENGEWYYVDGIIFPQELSTTHKKIGRNELCPCGSQKKFKKCCHNKK